MICDSEHLVLTLKGYLLKITVKLLGVISEVVLSGNAVIDLQDKS